MQHPSSSQDPDITSRFVHQFHSRPDTSIAKFFQSIARAVYKEHAEGGKGDRPLPRLIPKSAKSSLSSPMSSSLPPEILDHVIDHLHDEPTTLKTCCLVSKSCVPRARKHLFAHVEFDAWESHLEVWKKTFPDPPNSPAHHTRSLFIHAPPTITPADTDVGGWIQTFHNVTHLRLMRLNRAALAPLYGLSPAVKSLDLSIIPFEVFDLICSFPLLEDLALISLYPKDDAEVWNPPLTSPKLTGHLDMRTSGTFPSVTRHLLDLPGGLHFSKITAFFFRGDAESVTDLVSECSDTLESLTVLLHSSSAFPSTSVTGQYLTTACAIDVPDMVSLDLSKATKLKHVKFLRTKMRSTVRWIVKALQTVESKYLESITVFPFDKSLPETVEEEVYQEWQDLDRLLVRFWTSHSIRPQVAYVAGRRGTKDLEDDAPKLLPELTMRGLVDLVEICH